MTTVLNADGGPLTPPPPHHPLPFHAPPSCALKGTRSHIADKFNKQSHSIIQGCLTAPSLNGNSAGGGGPTLGLRRQSSAHLQLSPEICEHDTESLGFIKKELPRIYVRFCETAKPVPLHEPEGFKIVEVDNNTQFSGRGNRVENEARSGVDHGEAEPL